jgi:hypothetical protein
MKTWKNILLAAFTLLLAAGMMTACGSSQEAAGGTVSEPAMPESVACYALNYETEEWMPTSTITYTYQDGHLAERTEDFGDGEPVVATFEYEMNGDVPAHLMQYNDEHKLLKEYYYDDAGRADRVFTYSRDGSSTMEQIYQYGNEDLYFTMVLHETETIDPVDASTPLQRMEEVDSLEVTTNGGLLAKTVNNGLYANWTEGNEKVWQRFNGSYTAEYDANGILSETSAAYRESTSGKEYKFDVTVEDGRVTEIVRNRFNTAGNEEEGEWIADSKLVFTYTDIPATPAQYAAMINAHILGEGNGYYIYNWY